MENRALKVLFVINHKAGNQKKIDIKDIITKHAQLNGYQFDHCLMDDGNPKQKIAQEIDRYNPNIVAALGGDGTVNLVSSIIYKTAIKLLIVPFGSANGMAKELQILEDLHSCLDLIVEGKTVNIDLLEVNNQISMHLADVGINARIVKRFQMDSKRGLLTYAKHLFFEAFVLKSYHFNIEFDGKTKKYKAVSLTFANATKYGTGAVINPTGKLNDGFFEICIVKPFPKWHIFQISYQMFTNTLRYSEYFEVIKCKKAIVKCSRKTTLQIDGEIMGKTKIINLEILPQTLKVIINKNLEHPTLVN
ncbi:diacylglycerol kinase [Pedobacter psychrophilus]|uniref:Diacylglycerol kinase n=1 Tax=Pedobacter psychrophilus TaxID=1826909 RepID=A0A179DG14_9SPHI|nr:diacylglycerol kinase family protein [Pedobacter psychrophilus]OAQ39640.1 diacylglycerol kinase [Pedobacter psychrophilus]